MAKHTPGPWTIEDPMGEAIPWIVEAGKETYEWRCLAMVPCDEHKMPLAEAKANLKVIKAAPTMVEALLKVARASSRDEQLLALAAAKAALEEAGVIEKSR